VGLRVGLDAASNRKIPSPRRDSNPDHPIILIVYVICVYKFIVCMRVCRFAYSFHVVELPIATLCNQEISHFPVH
jgi:hypothetical protein